MNNIEKKYGCSIEHFIEDKYSICREERQYAVFLYNILRKYNTENKRTDEDIVSIFDACRIPLKAKIQSVFYEATFMRDFFERNRRILFGDEDCEKLEQRLLQKNFRHQKTKHQIRILAFLTLNLSSM